MSSEIRFRHQAKSQSTSDLTQEDLPRSRGESLTELPVMQANGQPATEVTTIPSNRGPLSHKDSGMDSSLHSMEGRGKNGSGSGNQSQTQVAKAEGKKRKIAIRVISSVLMIGTFLGLTYMGHVYICLLVALVELLLVSSCYLLILLWWSVLTLLTFF